MSQVQSLVMSNWARIVLSRRQTRTERRTFPKQIPNVLADPATLPVRLVKGRRLQSLAKVATALMIIISGSWLAAACSNPLAPAVVHADAYQPLHHDIPATFAGHPEGPVIYLCETKPRSYQMPDGRFLMERDHYLQYSHCPAVPID